MVGWITERFGWQFFWVDWLDGKNDVNCRWYRYWYNIWYLRYCIWYNVSNMYCMDITLWKIRVKLSGIYSTSSVDVNCKNMLWILGFNPLSQTFFVYQAIYLHHPSLLRHSFFHHSTLRDLRGMESFPHFAKQPKVRKRGSTKDFEAGVKNMGKDGS